MEKAVERIEIDAEWENIDNAKYYENIPIEKLRDVGKIGGFEDGCDIDVFYNRIENTQSVIEVGAAYGRVIKKLVSNSYKGKIFAVERSKNFYDYLQNNFGNLATIIHGDIQTLNFPKKFDALLWMWSNISDFPQKRQLSTLKHLSKWIKPDGLFIMDTILHTLIPKNATDTIDQNYVVDSKYGIAKGYVPSLEEIKSYAKQAGFKKIEHINYVTTTGRQRIIHILSEPI